MPGCLGLSRGPPAQCPSSHPSLPKVMLGKQSQPSPSPRAARSPLWGPGLGLREVAEEGVSLRTGTEPCVYKPWSGSAGGLLSTPAPRLAWQRGDVPNPSAPEHGSELPMGSRLLLMLMLLQAGEYHLSVPLPPPVPGQPLPSPPALPASQPAPRCGLEE